MGFFSEMDIDRQSQRKHAPPAGFQIRCMIEDLCELCGIDPQTETAFLIEFTQGFSCTSSQFWDRKVSDHPMRSLSYVVRRYLEECDDTIENDSSKLMETSKDGEEIVVGNYLVA